MYNLRQRVYNAAVWYLHAFYCSKLTQYYNWNRLVLIKVTLA